MQNKTEQTQGKRTLLFYTENYGKDRLVTQICRQMGVAVRKLKPSDVGTALIDLVSPGAKRSVPASKTPEGFRLPEVMVFAGFSRESMFEFLAAYNDAGIKKTELKAMLTPYNFTWSLYELIRELQQEQARILEKRDGAGDEKRETGPVIS